MSKASEKIKEEFLALLPPTIFFFFTLELVAVLRGLMLEGTGISLTTPVQVAVGALLLGKALERLVEFWRQAGGFAAGNEKMLAEMVWPHFWAIQIMLAVLIFGYCIVREISRAIGAERLRRMFFESPTAGPA
jgi:hypothetical protein